MCIYVSIIESKSQKYIFFFGWKYLANPIIQSELWSYFLAFFCDIKSKMEQFPDFSYNENCFGLLCKGQK